MFEAGGVPEGDYEIPLGEPSIKKTGNDLTIITFGPALYTALEAARRLEAQHGISAELIDLRSATPLNFEPLLESVRKTGRVLLACEAVERGSVMQSVAANLTQLAFDALDGPPVVVGSRNWITPAAELECDVLPAAGVAPGRHPRAHHPARRLRAGDRPDERRAGPPPAAGV